MPDQDVMDHIETLVAEEHALLEKAQADAGLDGDEHARLKEVQVDLDRYWDKLRQRRSMRETGGNPADAEPPGANAVENYKG